MNRAELVIVGAGPAGITAAIYAARQQIPLVLLTQDVGGQAVWSSSVENYTGYQMITGAELTARFSEHLAAFSIDIRTEVTVVRVSGHAGLFTTETTHGIWESPAVIIASGRTPRTLDVPGEKEFRNRGLAYCATCDAPLFAGKDVAVIGGGNAGFDAVLQLTRIARRITVLERSPSLTADPVMVRKALASGIVSTSTDTEVLEIIGDRFVTGVRIRRGSAIETVPAEGVFVEIGSLPNSSLAPDVEKNPAGEILVDCACRTSIDGMYAAGDVTSVNAKQIIVACAEGAKAAIAAAKFLHRR